MAVMHNQQLGPQDAQRVMTLLGTSRSLPQALNLAKLETRLYGGRSSESEAPTSQSPNGHVVRSARNPKA